jgi:hypothetical protein
MMRLAVVPPLAALLAACGPNDPAADSIGGDTAAVTSGDGRADERPRTDLTGTAWRGSGIELGFIADGGWWTDGCYGGHITPPFRVVDGAFDWPARFNVGAGAPEQREIRAVGTVAGDTLTLSILELSGEVFWGPWVLTPVDEATWDMCD